MKLKTILITSILTILSFPLFASDYVIDSEGAHASINFRIKHLGYSWLYGRFNQFNGTFSIDEKDISQSRIEVIIDTASIDSNHAKRDKHLRSEGFLDVDKFPQAKFISQAIATTSEEELSISGLLTLHGVTKEVIIVAHKVGEGKDPWGGYRAGYSGSTSITLKDFDIKANLGPASAIVELDLNIEGVRQ